MRTLFYLLILATPAIAEDALITRLGGVSFTVADLDKVEKSLAGAPVVKPRHDTFYGSTEIYVREPGGNTVGFAQFS